MAKTLLIKLAETVSGNLPYLGEMQFTVSKKTSGEITSFYIRPGTCKTIEIIGGDSDAHFTNSAGTSDTGKIKTFTDAQAETAQLICLSNNNATIRAYPCYGLISINSESNNIQIPTEQLRLCYGLEVLHVFNSSPCIIGDLSDLKNCTNLQQLYLNNNGTQITGNLSALSGMNLIRLVATGATNISGNISVFTHMTDMVELVLNNTAATGDISALAGLTNMTSLKINNTSIGGNTSSLAALHPDNGGKLATFIFTGSNVTGTWPPSA